jgi:tyrosinase
VLKELRFAAYADKTDSAGHYTINGENTDFYTSVNDPSFFLHHAMIDKIFWMWQVLHPAEARDIAGTLTLRNDPPLGNATIYDPLVMGVNAPTRLIHELQGTMDGTPLCYIYA